MIEEVDDVLGTLTETVNIAKYRAEFGFLTEEMRSYPNLEIFKRYRLLKAREKINKSNY